MNDKKPEGCKYNLAEAAEKTGYCEQHLRRLCILGQVACWQRGRNYFFTEADISIMLARRGPKALHPKPEPSPKKGTYKPVQVAVEKPAAEAEVKTEIKDLDL